MTGDATRPGALAPSGVTVRAATPGDEIGVRNVLDGAALAYGDLSAPDRTAFVAVDRRVVGALVRRDHERGGGAHVEAVAVRRARRGQGVGSALLAVAHSGRLTADFPPRVRPFYESRGFRVTCLDRCYGLHEGFD
jgi:GNAT superfamily N-acetyltransferase